MRITKNNKALTINLPSIEGFNFTTESLNGKPYMISFFRFATCPFCNLRVNQLVNKFSEFGEDFTIVAIFDSPLDHLTKHTKRHKAPFAILADEKNIYYKKYGIEKSVLGMLKGMIARFPALMKGLFKGYVPLSFKGSLITMPADFLVGRDGLIYEAYYGKDEGDHISLERVREFSLE